MAAYPALVRVRSEVPSDLPVEDRSHGHKTLRVAGEDELEVLLRSIPVGQPFFLVDPVLGSFQMRLELPPCDRAPGRHRPRGSLPEE